MGGMPQPQAKNSARSIDAQMFSGKANLRATMCGRCTQVDHEVELGRLLHREVGRFSALENLRVEGPDLPNGRDTIGRACPVGAEKSATPDAGQIYGPRTIVAPPSSL
jgi:hypothetical protein